MSQSLAQRIGQEFKTLRVNELSLKADAVALDAKITNPASGAKGDILYHNGTSYVRLPKGANGQVLSMVNGLPVWSDSTIG